mgnify:CR=1 FL=1
MRDPEKLKEEMDERNRKILDVAFELFVDKKIEAEPAVPDELAVEAMDELMPQVLSK